MNDRELLELAAKAAGLSAYVYIGPEGLLEWVDETDDEEGYFPNPVQWWNPIRSDGDALWLAVKLRIWVDYYGCGSSVPAYVSANYHLSIYRGTRKYVNVYYVPDEMFTSDRQDERSHALYQMEEEGHPRGIEVATRRAIVRAAAEIGRQMHEVGAT
jgi:hypothetical protein